MRFHDLYIGANRLLWQFTYIQCLKGLFQPQRKVQTYFLTSTQYIFAVNIELLHTKTRSHIVCSSPNIDAHLITVCLTLRECVPVLKKLLLQWVSRLQASKNVILNFPGAITYWLSTDKPPICVHWCILMLYAVFGTFHALVNPIRQDILRGGAIDVFVFFRP